MAAFSSAQVAQLAASGRLERVAKRTVVAVDAALVTIVAEGWFRVIRNAAFVRDVTLALAGPGELLAPGVLFGERSAESGAQALGDGAVLLVPPDAVENAAQDDPSLYPAIARSLALRTLRVQRKLEAFSRSTLEARVAAALLEIAEGGGTAQAGGAIRLGLALSQEELAGLAGTTRESCSSTVAEFARRGLVRGSRLKGLILTDPRGLASLAAVDFRGP